MRNSVKVAQLDLRTLQIKFPWWALLLATDVVILVLAMLNFDVFAIIVGIVFGAGSSLVMVPFYSNQQRGVDGLLAALPVTRRQVVFGHYLFAVGVQCVIALNLFVVAAIYSFLRPDDLPLSVAAMVALGALTFFLVLVAVPFPFLMRVGYSSATIGIYTGVIVLVVIGLNFLSALGDNFSPSFTFGWVVAGAVALLVGSVPLSLHWYSKREL
ncbi:ABC-2 transporter permease [Lacticaseibacillus mingshuiensis]|uniref:ABC-2 transporter permease n=1 Tax=Lacticaseibacillus mingshuiensis TaxID=2799574 RepID=A0ABW4CMN6_9LACO|nr:ABC-2 transporter permease [Lacticaseibacillus mingshuiensis]